MFAAVLRRRILNTSHHSYKFKSSVDQPCHQLLSSKRRTHNSSASSSSYLRPFSISRYIRDTWNSTDKNWALVTGAGDGIGQEFAIELSERGFDVVINDRNQSKLDRVQKELNRRHPKSQTRTLVCDGNISTSYSLNDDILAEVKDLKLRVLTNNVGGTANVQAPDDFYSTIDKCSIKAVDGIVNINARFTSQIAQLLLPLLLKRPRSFILNISSGVKWGMPYLSVYSGTKSYITTWSKALLLEMMAERRNVEVLAIGVGSVGLRRGTVIR